MFLRFSGLVPRTAEGAKKGVDGVRTASYMPPSPETLNWLRGAARHISKAGFCAENCRFRGSLRSSAESAKKGVDGEFGGSYKPPLPKRGRLLPPRQKRAPARLFDIVGLWKRNAGGMNGLRSPQGLQCDHDDAFQGNTFHFCWFRPVML